MCQRIDLESEESVGIVEAIFDKLFTILRIKKKSNEEDVSSSSDSAAGKKKYNPDVLGREADGYMDQDYDENVANIINNSPGIGAKMNLDEQDDQFNKVQKIGG